MEPLSLGMTDMVAGAGGAGFNVPVIRLNAGVSANTQTPESRAATMDSMVGDLYNENQVLDPISELRDEFDNGVAALNDWVVESLQQGIDPRFYDPSNPESRKRNRAFVEEKIRLRRLRDDLITTGELRKEGKLIVPTDAKDAKDAVSRMVAPTFAQAVQDYNGGVSAAGYDEGESFEGALASYEQAAGQLLGVYQDMLNRVGDDPSAREALKASYLTAVAGMRKPNVKNMTEYQRRMLDIRDEEIRLRKKQIEEKDDTPIFIDRQNTDIRVRTTDGKASNAIKYRKEVVGFPATSLPNVSGFMLESEVDGTRLKKGSFSNIFSGRIETFPIDSNGEPILPDTKYPKGVKVAGYRMFGVGSDDKGRVVYFNPSVLPNMMPEKMRSSYKSYFDKLDKDANAQAGDIDEFVFEGDAEEETTDVSTIFK